MSNITIPPAALEAGARATFEEFYKRSPVLPDDDDMMDLARIYARAAFLAMVSNWPGVDKYLGAVVLPLMENPDDKA